MIDQQLFEYGVVGAVLASLFGLLLKILADHKAERDRWMDAYRTGQDRVANSVDKLADEIREYYRRTNGK